LRSEKERQQSKFTERLQKAGSRRESDQWPDKNKNLTCAVRNEFLLQNFVSFSDGGMLPSGNLSTGLQKGPTGGHWILNTTSKKRKTEHGQDTSDVSVCRRGGNIC
jgi:hypothetical protein